MVHTYTIAGTNTVRLIASGPLGASTNTQANLITVQVPPRLAISPASRDYGSLLAGQTNTQTFSVINTGGLALTGTATVSTPFAISAGSAFNIAPSQTGTVAVSFLPQTEGQYTNLVLFASNGGGATGIVTAAGLLPGKLVVKPYGFNCGTIATGD